MLSNNKHFFISYHCREKKRRRKVIKNKTREYAQRVREQAKRKNLGIVEINQNELREIHDSSSLSIDLSNMGSIDEPLMQTPVISNGFQSNQRKELLQHEPFGSISKRRSSLKLQRVSFEDSSSADSKRFSPNSEDLMSISDLEISGSKDMNSSIYNDDKEASMIAARPLTKKPVRVRSLDTIVMNTQEKDIDLLDIQPPVRTRNRKIDKLRSSKRAHSSDNIFNFQEKFETDNWKVETSTYANKSHIHAQIHHTKPRVATDKSALTDKEERGSFIEDKESTTIERDQTQNHEEKNFIDCKSTACYEEKPQYQQSLMTVSEPEFSGSGIIFDGPLLYV